MGGGWGRQGTGVPLSQRVRADQPHVDPRAAHPSALAGPGPSCPARHCWVIEAADGEGVKRPGLLVEWRRSAAGWEGRVVYAASLRAGEWALVEEWVPAAWLAPA